MSAQGDLFMSDDEKASRYAREGTELGRIIAAHEVCREELVRLGFDLAVYLATSNGTVTSTEVLEAVRRLPEWADEVAACDPRWLGAVFRRKGWEGVGRAPLGSHLRTVPIWRWIGVPNG